jgi:hypothetical protein
LLHGQQAFSSLRALALLSSPSRTADPPRADHLHPARRHRCAVAVPADEECLCLRLDSARPLHPCPALHRHSPLRYPLPASSSPSIAPSSDPLPTLPHLPAVEMLGSGEQVEPARRQHVDAAIGNMGVVRDLLRVKKGLGVAGTDEPPEAQRVVQPREAVCYRDIVEILAAVSLESRAAWKSRRTASSLISRPFLFRTACRATMRTCRSQT